MQNTPKVINLYVSHLLATENPMTRPGDYRPDNPLPRTPDNHKRGIKVTPRNMGRRYNEGQRSYGDKKAQREQDNS